MPGFHVVLHVDPCGDCVQQREHGVRITSRLKGKIRFAREQATDREVHLLMAQKPLGSSRVRAVHDFGSHPGKIMVEFCMNPRGLSLVEVKTNGGFSAASTLSRSLLIIIPRKKTIRHARGVGGG